MKRFLKNLGAALRWCFGFADAAAESLVADDHGLIERRSGHHAIDAEFTISEARGSLRNHVDGPPFENGTFIPFVKPKRKAAKKSSAKKSAKKSTKKSSAAPERKKKTPAKPARKTSPRR
jgi:hypothetical protein